MTARELINSSLRLLGVTASGENTDAAEAKDTLEALNMMLASASANKLLIPYMKTQTVILSGERTLLAERPLRLEQMTINAGGVDFPVSQVSMEEYQDIAVKSTAGRPAYFALDKVFPTSSIFVYPTPDIEYTATIRRWDALTSVSDLDDEIDLPGEYLRALKYNLAIEVAPEFGRKVSDVIAARASESLSLISTLNAPPLPAMVTDIPGTRGTAYKTWSIEAF